LKRYGNDLKVKGLHQHRLLEKLLHFLDGEDVRRDAFSAEGLAQTRNLGWFNVGLLEDVGLAEYIARRTVK
jgi:hypothetical protein